MKTIGIVVEYNPFHNGHLYQLKKIREMYSDALIIIAMSGNYIQRGDFSIIDKWDKTQLALNYGVDIVLEIPFVFSNQSADKFSYAALKMLSEFKIDTLVFGSESAREDDLFKCANIQINNKFFDEKVKYYLEQGYNYPTSLSKSIYDITKIMIKESNDLLAISYIKEIIKNNYKIDVAPIKRTNSYLDILSEEDIVSASNIRNKFYEGIDVSRYVPKDTIKFMRLIDFDKYFNLLKYKIISENTRLNLYHLVDDGIVKRIYEAAKDADNLDEMIAKIKNKRYTYNKINRILINIFCGFTKEDANNFSYLEYIRVLGFSSSGRKYYSTIKKDMSLPVITKFSKYRMLEIELKVTILYGLIVGNNILEKEEIKKHAIIL